jgi:hypothetical protein
VSLNNLADEIHSRARSRERQGWRRGVWYAAHAAVRDARVVRGGARVDVDMR